MLPIRQKNFFTKLLNFLYWTPLTQADVFLHWIMSFGAILSKTPGQTNLNL